MVPETENRSNTDVNTENIFEEFETDADLQTEVKKIEENQQKDMYYYLHLSGRIIKSLNILLLLVFIVAASYFYIQKSEDAIDLSFAQPICRVFLGDASDKVGNCSGVFSTLATYQKQTSTRMQEQYVQVLPMIEEIYGVYNFLESRYVAFLVEQSDERIRPIEVLSAFDTLKNEFEPILKSNIQCRDFVISEGNVLKAKCEAFTSRLDDRIVGFSGNRSGDAFVEGTSASLAASFLNYIERKSEKFLLLNKQKEFTVERVSGQGTYVKKTTFTLELQYVGDNLIL